MDHDGLFTGRIGEINGNIRLIVALLAGWAGLSWWLNLSMLASAMLAGAAGRQQHARPEWPLVLSIALALFGFATAFITAFTLLAIDRQVGEMQTLSKTLADTKGQMAAGTAERSRFLKPQWPLAALAWAFGLHAAGAAAVAIVWVVLAFAAMR